MELEVAMSFRMEQGTFFFGSLDLIFNFSFMNFNGAITFNLNKEADSVNNFDIVAS